MATKDRNPLPPDMVAHYIKRLQGLSIPKRTLEATAGDVARHNDVVLDMGNERLDFFDVPGNFVRALKTGGSGEGSQ